MSSPFQQPRYHLLFPTARKLTESPPAKKNCISNHPRLVVFECHPSIAMNSFSMILRAPDARAATWHKG